jgi:hypothetical protein
MILKMNLFSPRGRLDAAARGSLYTIGIDF